MPDPENPTLSANLRRLVETVDVANALVEPLSRSIENLLQVSAAELNSEDASVLIRDGEEGDLRFLAVVGKVADTLRNMTIPAGKGVAGFVFSSGQPMIVSDATAEESFYAEVDKQTGYSTQMLLATPLRHNGEVIGVLEYINRRGEPPFDAFTPDEMDKAAVFAEAVAPLVNAYESAKVFREMGEKSLSENAEVDTAMVREWLSGIRTSTEHREMMDLALLVRDIASRGDAERRMCREVLEAILRFSDSQGETSFLNY